MAVDTEPTDRTQEVNLPANHTFVVQVRHDNPLSTEDVWERIEHEVFAISVEKESDGNPLG